MDRYDAKEKLIDLVKLNPGLWKHSRKAPGLKQKIWDKIGEELQTTGYDARRQWEILRDQLRRENKRFKQNPNYKSKWMFYTKMLFTLPQNDAQASAGCSDDGDQYHPDHKMQHENYHYLTIPKTEEEQSIIQVRRDLQESNDGLLNHLPSGDEYSPAPLTTVAAVAAAPPPTVEDYYPSTSAGVSSSTQLPRYAENVDICCETKQTTRNKRYPDGSAEDDEDYYFAMSLVPSLQCIPRSKKLRLRSRIMDLIAVALEEQYEQENNIMSVREDVSSNNEIEEKIIIPSHKKVEISMEELN